MSRLRGHRRDADLRKLGYRDYADYLRSPEWAATRLRYYEAHGRTCCLCGTDEQIQLHHLTYERVGQELPDDLAGLCANCHAMVHVLERRGELALDFQGFVSAARAEKYAADRRPIPAPDPRPDYSHDPPEVRLRRVMRAAKASYIDISSDLQVIKQRVSKMERKVLAART